MNVILILWRRRLSVVFDWIRNFGEIIIDEGDEWFLILTVVIVLLMVGFCILLVLYDPVALKNSQWRAP